MAEVEVGTPQTDITPQINITLQQTSVGVQAVLSTLLTIFVIVGFVGNSVLITIIAQSGELRRAVLNLHVISIAVVNVIDSVLNIPLILATCVSQTWYYGDVVCSLNGFTVQLVSIVMIVGLCFMSLDRLVSVSNFSEYTHKMTTTLTNVIIVYSWLHGIALSLPIVINSISTMVYSARYLCSIAPNSSLIYIIFVTVLGYLLPLLIIFLLFICILKVSCQRKAEDRRIKRSVSCDTNSEVDIEKIQNEIHAAKYVGVLIICWCVCEGPFLFLVSIEQYKNSDRLSPDPSDENVSNFQYPWELDMAFTWLKLSYPLVLPILSIFWRREVWLRLKNCCGCKKYTDNRQNQNGNVNRRHNHSTSVPVLFATENGLHFQHSNDALCQDSNDDDDESGIFSNEAETNTKSSVFTSQNMLRSRKCDVQGSGFIHQQARDDSSDNDSQQNEQEPDVLVPNEEVSDRSVHNIVAEFGKKGQDKINEDFMKEFGNDEGIDTTAGIINETKPSKNRKKDKKRPVEKSGARLGSLPPIVNKTAKNQSLIARNDSGNDSGEKNVKKKKRNKKQKKKVIEIEHSTINSHSTDDMEVQPEQGESFAMEEKDAASEGNHSDSYKKKKKKKNKKKIDIIVNGDDVDQAMTFENDAFTGEKDSSHSPEIGNNAITSNQKADEDMFFQKRDKPSDGHRQLPEPPHKSGGKAKHKISGSVGQRRFTDDMDIIRSNKDGDLTMNGAKTGHAYNRFFSHDFEVEHAQIVDNDRPLPSLRKAKLTSNEHSGEVSVVGESQSPKIRKTGGNGEQDQSTSNVNERQNDDSLSKQKHKKKKNHKE